MTREPFMQRVARAMAEHTDQEMMKLVARPYLGGFPLTKKELELVHPTIATKFDNGKLQYDLFPDEVLKEIIQVFTFGARKYGRFNWLKGGGMKFDRLRAAAMRHFREHKVGNLLDEETGLGHLSHAIVCLIMLRTYEMIGREDDSEWAELRQHISAGSVDKFLPVDTTQVEPDDTIGSAPSAASRKPRRRSKTGVRRARRVKPRDKRKMGV